MCKIYSNKIIIVIVTILGAVFLDSYNHLLFHSIFELFSIVIGYCVFMVAWESRNASKQRFYFLIFIGISYFFTSSLDVLHTLSYKGMHIFDESIHYSSQLWVASRYLESVSLFLPFIFFKSKKKMNLSLIFSVYIIVTVAIIYSIFIQKTFPICFVEGKGQTLFKIVSDYVICLMLIGDTILIKIHKYLFDNKVYKYILWSITATIASEYSFLLYSYENDFFNLMGHYFKVVSFYLIYKAIIVTGISALYDKVSNELKEKKRALRMYKKLFNSIDECFCIIDVVYDSNRKRNRQT